MNIITNDIRVNQYKRASQAQYYLTSNIEAGLNLRNIAQKYDLHQDEAYKKFAVTVGDIILGFYKIEDTVPLLRQELGIDMAIAERLGADVLVFLAPLSDPNWQPPVDEDREDSAGTETTATTVQSVTPTVNEVATPRGETVAFVPIKSSLDTSPLNPFIDKSSPLPLESHDISVAADQVPPTSQIPAYEPAPRATSANPPIPIIEAPRPPVPVASAPRVNTPPPITSPFETPDPVPRYAPLQNAPGTNDEPVYRSTQPSRAALSDIPSYQEITAQPETKAPENSPRWSTG
jgi:hypothetical protein